MMTNSDSLQQILNSTDTSACLKFFQGMSEQERRGFFPQIKKSFAVVKRNRVIETSPGNFSINPTLANHEIAFFATATFSELKQATRSIMVDDDSVMQILNDRRPTWIDDWIEILLSGTYYWASWRLIRRLIIAKLAKRPDVPNYYLGMIGAFHHRREKQSLREILQEGPDLLQHDIWKLFEYEGEGENSLANHDRFRGGWADTFIELMNMGMLPRERLLESSLQALERDFNHYRARWFLDFYDRLNPSETEAQQHGTRYLGLLRASAPNVVSWAFDKVEGLTPTGSLAITDICPALLPVMQSRTKTLIIRAIRLLEKSSVDAPGAIGLIASTAVSAMAHEKADVQSAALDLLVKLNALEQADVKKTIAKYRASFAASVAKRLTTLINDSSPTTLSESPAKSTDQRKSQADLARRAVPKVSQAHSDKLNSLFELQTMQNNLQKSIVAIPASTFDGTDIPRLRLLKPITPIQDLEELVDVSSRVIEDGSLVDDVERCIAGITKFCDKSPEESARMTGPLLKRVRQLISKGASPFCGLAPENDLLGLLYTFCTGTIIEVKFGKSKISDRNGDREWTGAWFDFEGKRLGDYDVNMKKPIGFLSRRSQQIARQVQKRVPFQLLSTPTHEHGWISPQVLADRASQWAGPPPDDKDVVLALLRTAPDGRSQALKGLTSTNAEWMHSIQYALGDPQVTVGSTKSLWAAAARAKSPWTDDPQILSAFPELGPDVGEAASYSFVFKKRKSSSYTFIDIDVKSAPEVPKVKDPDVVTTTLHTARKIGREYSFETGGFGGKTPGAIRWTATIWPAARESFFAGAAQTCLDNLDWSEAEWQNRTYLEPLLDEGTPLRNVGLHFLVGMLSAKEPGESGLATDIAIRAIEEGRLGSDNLGSALHNLILSQVVKPGRWQKALAQIAACSPIHGAVVQVALQTCLSGDPSEFPKDFGKLLELLYEMSVELNLTVTSPECLAFLKLVGTTGKSGKLAKDLLILAVTPQTTEATQAIMTGAISMREAAASRFD